VAKRILVVEDNDLNRKLFCDVLKANGHEVVPVADGRNVVATAQRFVPDLVIMDIQLPHVSGIDLIGQLKADPALAGMVMLRQSRLSVSPVSKAEFDHIVALSKA